MSQLLDRIGAKKCILRPRRARRERSRRRRKITFFLFSVFSFGETFHLSPLSDVYEARGSRTGTGSRLSLHGRRGAPRRRVGGVEAPCRRRQGRLVERCLCVADFGAPRGREAGAGEAWRAQAEDGELVAFRGLRKTGTGGEERKRERRKAFRWVGGRDRGAPVFFFFLSSFFFNLDLFLPPFKKKKTGQAPKHPLVPRHPRGRGARRDRHLPGDRACDAPALDARGAERRRERRQR